MELIGFFLFMIAFFIIMLVALVIKIFVGIFNFIFGSAHEGRMRQRDKEWREYEIREKRKTEEILARARKQKYKNPEPIPIQQKPYVPVPVVLPTPELSRGKFPAPQKEEPETCYMCERIAEHYVDGTPYCQFHHDDYIDGSDDDDD